ncbi:glycoside hydrolase family 25 protein [Amycolatopsis suaedae]|uniref:Glycoside hydrolase n=1 Tax=Amycolatopsis suaedae TaxID=2510978 RepID=A0A4Q7J4U5_9PSEU|nr:glycoside hydrolase family 25 protein [Amycolatopsis suaedae]RZQ61692.1 glycoside hydrolase [Amycolatopsis suaedae]
MVLFGLDISHHQGGAPDLPRARAEGVEYVFCKSTEGSTFVDPRFGGNVARVRGAGMLVAAYHYQRNTSAAAQVDNVRRVVPTNVPVIPDVEANSGSVALTRELVDRLRGAGYSVPLLYLPRWYWQQIGSPSLAGLPPLWSSRYPDNAPGTIPEEYADVPPHYWNGYGGLGVAVLQFSSSGRVAGYGPLDLNAYQGTKQQLAALLGGQQEDDMPSVDDLLNGKVGERPDGSYVSLKDAVINPYLNLYYANPQWDQTKIDAIMAKLGTLTTLVAKENGVSAEDIAGALRSGFDADLRPVLQEAAVAELGEEKGQQFTETVLARLGERLSG